MQRWYFPNIIQEPDARATDDLATLFQQDWSVLTGKVDVFGFYVDPVRGNDQGPPRVDFLTDALPVIDTMGAVIAVEAGGALGNNGGVTCGTGPEDNAHQSSASEIIKMNAIYDRGGTVTYLQLDCLPRTIEGGVSQGGSVCGFTAEQAALAIATYIVDIHENLDPDIKCGIITQPTNWQSGYTGTTRPAYGAGTSPVAPIDEMLDAVFDAVAAAGERLWFVHLDAPPEYLNSQVIANNRLADDWWARCRAIQQDVQSRGVRFGLAALSYFGGSSALTPYPSDWSFGQGASNLQNGWLGRYARDADDFLVQSFYEYPRAILPNAAGTSFTDTYLRLLATAEANPPSVLIDGEPAQGAGTAPTVSSASSVPALSLASIAPRATAATQTPVATASVAGRPALTVSAPRPR